MFHSKTVVTFEGTGLKNKTRLRQWKQAVDSHRRVLLPGWCFIYCSNAARVSVGRVSAAAESDKQNNIIQVGGVDLSWLDWLMGGEKTGRDQEMLVMRRRNGARQTNLATANDCVSILHMCDCIITRQNLPCLPLRLQKGSDPGKLAVLLWPTLTANWVSRSCSPLQSF